VAGPLNLNVKASDSHAQAADAVLGLTVSQTLTPATVYTYSVPTSGGYAPNGNLLSYTDSVMGTWNFSYDYDGSLDATYTLSGTTLTATTQDLFLNGEHLGFFSGASNIYRSALDWVGSVRTRVDPSANIISGDRNFPFGEMQTEYLPSMPSWGDTDDTIHFTGKERDAESGLDYFGARYYASSMGRFLSPDPSGLSYSDPKNPQSLNLYTYGLNNPLTNTDPTGLTCQTNSNDGSTYDDNDGKGCDAAGIAGDGTVIDPNNRQSVTVNPPSPGTDLGYDSQVAYDQQLLASRQLQQGQSLWSMTPQQRIYKIALAQPTTCGGGVFAYGGRSLDAGPANGFAGGIVEADSNSGVSKGALFEGGGGEGVIGGGGYIVSNDSGGLGSSNFAYGGAGVELPGAHASVGEVGFSSGIGAYADVSAGGREVGAGAYLNITTNAGCMAVKK